MPLQYDPEFAKLFETLGPVLAKRPYHDLDNIAAGRDARNRPLAAACNRQPDSPDVEQKWHHTSAPDGFQIPILALTKKRDNPAAVPGPAILHFHGGGMTGGTAEMFAKPLAQIVSATGTPIFTVDYRLAPDVQGTKLVEDCYAGLTWLRENAAQLSVDTARIAVFGESAGGGLAAGVALMARDQKLDPPLVKQVLVYPMLDDRNNKEREFLEPFAFWRTRDNFTSWKAVLGRDVAGVADADISPYAVPARAKSLAGLPATYIDVGILDIFRDEDVEYAARLLAEGVHVELHVVPGVPHGFDLIGYDLSASVKARAWRLEALRSI